MTEQELRKRLVDLVSSKPEARIVTDVGASMFSGWGDLISVEYLEDSNVIELGFS